MSDEATKAAQALPPFLAYRPAAAVSELRAQCNLLLQQFKKQLDEGRGLMQAKQLGVDHVLPITAVLFALTDAIMNDLALHANAVAAYLLQQNEPRTVLGLHPEDADEMLELLTELHEEMHKHAGKDETGLSEQLKSWAGQLELLMGQIGEATLDDDDAPAPDDGDDNSLLGFDLSEEQPS